MEKKFIKILAVDDNPDNLVVLKALINDAFPNIVFITAASGKTGIEHARFEKPDVILLDIVMPGMDGYEVCKILKEDNKLKHIPVVMVTANRADKLSRVKALEAGADAFLTKPVDESELKAQINAMLRIKESEDQKKEEKIRLENMVIDRTAALELELADRKKAENKLIFSLDKITRNRKAILNLMEDLKSEINERKLTEEKLNYERNLLRTLIDNIPDTIYILDDKGRKIIANRADVSIIGCDSESDVIGKTDEELFPGEVGKRFHKMNLSVISSGKLAVDLEEEFIDRKGEIHWLQSSYYPLSEKSGRVSGLIGIGHDITERKKTAEDLIRKNKELHFLNTLATDIKSMVPEEDLISFLLARLKEFTGSQFLAFSEFDSVQNSLITRHIEADHKLLKNMIKIVGHKILNNPSPMKISEETINEILSEIVTEKASLNDISFGAVPFLVDKAISAFTGFDRYFGLSFVVSGQLFGTTMLAFRKDQPSPSKELLKSFAHIAAVSFQRRKVEEKLKQSEEKYRLLIENQGEGVVIVDLKETFVFANPAAEEMLGVDYGALAGRKMGDFISRDQLKLIIEKSEKKPISEKSTYEIEIMRPGGEKRTVLVTATAQFDSSGVHSGTFGVFRDITERKELELKIMESEAYYRTLIDISPDGIFTIDMEGVVTYGSIKALEIFGLPPDENLTGTSVLSWVSSDYIDIVLERISDIIEGVDSPLTREYKLLKYNKSTFWAELSSSPLKDKNGDPIGLLVVCRDISYRKKAEQELIKARDKAEESDRLKTAFLHNISHEIRTPMNAIVGFSSLLSDESIDKQTQKAYTDVIAQSSNHLLSIISDIVDISNIEANLVKTSKTEVNINSVLKSLCEQFRVKIEGKNVSIICETGLDDKNAMILTDNTKLVQILSNLIGNAIKFTDEGLVKIKYCQRGDFLEVSVSDTGIGIPEEHQSKIFERFYQVQSLESRLYEGTGLGLSISKAYVELLGGKIWLHSEPGNGTTFFFTIPYEPKVMDSIEDFENNLSDRFSFPLKRTILVVEDIDSNFKLINYFLSKANVDVIRAVNGREAVDKALSDIKIDLILMDIKMPVMDGYTATRMIRDQNKTIPIIAQTAYTEDKDKAYESGCSGFLSKPFDKKNLFKVLNEYL